ncbi:MAG: hypothetical protein FJY85_23515, partial [Deltaproteobacteria bacterium]|nr:hypothetical protein [Deltaproteobacteria bacterium]
MIESARAYHDETSYDRHNLKGRHLDWGSQPNVFKAYPGLKSEPLPKIKSWPDVSLSSLFKEGERVDSHDRMDLNRLSRILSMTHALTAKIRQVGGDFYFRSIA